MPVKRRNHGRAKKNRGKTRALHCSNCGRLVPKDKAIKKYLVRNMVDVSSQRDIREASVIPNYMVPKLYLQLNYCVSCGIHSRVVRVRSRKNRRNRDTQQRPRPFPAT
eukprot:Filipodium_phascolosomae@DN955_c0_g1_i1.p1